MTEWERDHPWLDAALGVLTLAAVLWALVFVFAVFGS